MLKRLAKFASGHHRVLAILSSPSKVHSHGSTYQAGDVCGTFLTWQVQRRLSSSVSTATATVSDATKASSVRWDYIGILGMLALFVISLDNYILIFTCGGQEHVLFLHPSLYSGFVLLRPEPKL